MKFSCYVDIKLPLDQVIKKWDNNDNLKYWQDGFLRCEFVSGEEGKEGAKTKYFYKQGRGEMELLETILKNDLPREFNARYEHKHMSNDMCNRFEVLSEDETRWVTDIHYDTILGFIPKIMVKLFPRIFKKQVQKWLDQFKRFAEESLN